MKIKKVSWRNFGSYGNRTQILSLDNGSKLVEISGFNGNGKSTISQVITFALYGKLENKKLKEIPNRINGCAWTKIELESNSKEIVIERGVDPSLFNVWIDGKIFDKAGSKTVQDFLVEEIYGIPYYVFNNTISLSVNDFKSFLKMTPSDKRMIIDKIFGFEVINKMKEIVKEEGKKVKESQLKLKSKISSISSSIERSQSELDILLEQINQSNEEELSMLGDRIDKLDELTVIHDKKWKEFLDQERDLKNSIRSSYDIVSTNTSLLKEIDKKVLLYNQDKCPTCSTSFKGDEFVSIKDELIIQRESVTSLLEDSRKEYNNLNSIESELSSKKELLIQKGSKIKNEISLARNRITELTLNKNDLQVSSIEKILRTFRNELVINDESLKKDENKSDFLKKMEDILGEKGIKQLALLSVIPSLNSTVQNYMNKLSLPFSLSFNSEFNPILSHMGEEISPSTLSTGESKKVDFVVLISILKVLKMKFNSLNLLFLDELFSSVDSEGIESISEILRDLSRAQNLNVFVINHAPLPIEMFDDKISVVKKNNFSVIEYNI
jgi:DNA repair exonuclease SbcCD ATPase subunit